MSSRRSRTAADRSAHGRIRSDLRERGVAPDLLAAFVERLAPISEHGSRKAYEAALDAVMLAYHNGSFAPPDSESLKELQRLIAGFAVELRKLQEGMRILDAYVTRMRTQTEEPGDRRVH